MNKIVLICVVIIASSLPFLSLSGMDDGQGLHPNKKKLLSFKPVSVGQDNNINSESGGDSKSTFGTLESLTEFGEERQYFRSYSADFNNGIHFAKKKILQPRTREVRSDNFLNLPFNDTQLVVGKNIKEKEQEEVGFLPSPNFKAKRTEEQTESQQIKQKKEIKERSRKISAEDGYISTEQALKMQNDEDDDNEFPKFHSCPLFLLNLS